MLILQRKAGQSFRIGEDVTITVQEISGGRVRLSVDAPKSVSIVREEVLEARKENCSAALAQESPMQLLAMLKKGMK